MKATPTAANRALVTLHGLMKFAVRKGHRADNPAKGVKYYKEKARERYLTEAETARLARAIAEAEGKESPFVLAAFKLVLLTGCRQGEIFTLGWSEVDLERGVLSLGDTKTGARVVYLNEAAQDVLANLPRVEGNPYVIPGWKKGEH
jgi:integrase